MGSSLRAWALLAAVGSAACGNSEPGGGSPGAVPEASTAQARPELFSSARKHVDLLAVAHLADLDHEGLFIELGTPARQKYTMGGWNTGWLADERTPEGIYTLASEAARLYFDVREAGPLTLRMRLRPVGTGVVTVYLNGQTIGSVRLGAEGAWGEHEVAVPAQHVRRGENQLMLRFGGSRQVGGEKVSAAVAWVRVIAGPAPAAGAPYTAPTQASLVGAVELGGVREQALTVPRGTTMSFYVDVPAGAHLGFGVGGEAPAGAGAAPTAKIVVTGEAGGPAELFSRPAGERWHYEALSLESFAGKVVRIDLVADGEGPGRVAWAAPAVLVPRPTAPPTLATARNVVVLLIDTQRADRLKAFDPSTRVRTPTVSQLAAEGAVFARAQSPENWTKPATASVLTGLWPITHDAKSDAAVLSGEALLLSEHLKASGFRTASFVANGYVSEKFGFNQGWDQHTNYIREERGTSAALVFREAGDWIEANRGERFFVYLHTIEPHVPYDPPADLLALYDAAEYDGPVRPRLTPTQLADAKADPPRVVFTARDAQRLRALYDGEVTHHDMELAKFIERLRALGVWDQTLFVLTADHGEEFNEHGSWGHGHTVYQELLHVPLLFRLPGTIPAGARVEEVVSTVSVPQTVAAAVGAPAMPAAEGQNLLEFFTHGAPDGLALAFSDHLTDRKAIYNGRWKLIVRGATPTLFHVAADPTEQTELDRGRHAIPNRYLRGLLGQFLGARNRQQWLRAAQDPPAQQLRSTGAEMDDATRAQLRALGYAQ